MKRVQGIPIYPLVVKLFFKYNPWLFIIDQLIRIALLLLYLQNFLTTGWFIALQMLLLIVVSLQHDWYQKVLHKKYGPYVTAKYSRRDVEIDFVETYSEKLFAIQAFLGFIFSLWFFYRTIRTDAWYMYLLIIFLTIFGTVTFIIPLTTTFRIRKSKFRDYQVFEKIPILNKKGEKVTRLRNVSKHHPEIIDLEKLQFTPEETVELDTIDYNDSQIAKLESELKGITYKIDAWMLESVFLGGLAFSGFLTVASANFLGKETEVFNEFINHAAIFFKSCLYMNVTDWFEEFEQLFDRNDLYILIMLLCLLSSVFFLLVLTLRLRLNRLTLTMDHLIRIMNIFNAKEEELHNLSEEPKFTTNQKRRLEKVSRKTDLAINDAINLSKDLKPLMTLMSFYRNLAVLLFYIVLIVSGFYFLPWISVIIFALACFTQLFRLLEAYSKLGKLKNLLRRH